MYAGRMLVITLTLLAPLTFPGQGEALARADADTQSTRESAGADAGLDSAARGPAGTEAGRYSTGGSPAGTEAGRYMIGGGPTRTEAGRYMIGGDPTHTEVGGHMIGGSPTHPEVGRYMAAGDPAGTDGSRRGNTGGPGAPGTARIIKTAEGYRLERDGKPFFIKGAVGATRPDLLVASGANSMRTSVRELDRARELGLTCLVGLPLANPRHNFDYADKARVDEQFNRARQVVEKYKDHPALLMWAIGNEPEIHTTPEQRAPVWREVNRIAEMVRQVDGRHPVITVIGDAYRKILHEVDAQCPAIDAIGLNSYVDMLTMPEDVKREGWTRPYVVTEFGPRGHWQVPKTSWKVPIEDNSTQKAEFYRKAYRHAVEGRPQCLGSYVFYWSHKQEKTHTWYGLFLPDGSRTGAIDTMVEAWTGRPPKQRCPLIGPKGIELSREPAGEPPREAIFPAGAKLSARVEAADPDGDPVKITWDLRVDVADNPNVGGDYEPDTPPITGAVSTDAGSAARAAVMLPQKPGKYRLFVYAHDGQGNAATANVPILATEGAER